MDENYKEEGLKKILAKKVKKLIFKAAIGRVKGANVLKYSEVKVDIAG